MRSRILSLLLAALALAMIPVVAKADGHYKPHGYSKGDVHRHHYHRHKPRKRRALSYDRYAYQWEPRGYYPYYNSRHWAPVRKLRYRRACCRPNPELPPYYQAWGHPHRYYNHRKWHRKHFGYHRHGHW